MLVLNYILALIIKMLLSYSLLMGKILNKVYIIFWSGFILNLLFTPGLKKINNV